MVWLVLIVIALLLLDARSRLKELADQVQGEREAHDDLLKRIAALEALEKGRTRSGAGQPASGTAAPSGAPAPDLPKPAIPSAVPAPAPGLAPPPPSAIPALPPLVRASAPAPLVVRATPPPSPTPPIPQERGVEAAAPTARPTVAPPRPPMSSPPTPPPSIAPSRPFDWESLVGVKLFSWIAGILFALTAILFLRYSIDHGWLKPPIRMAMGLAMGAGLLALSEHRAARRYAITANALEGAGIVALFSTLFAAHTLWHLLGSTPTFVLMVLVAAVAVGLSIRNNALFIALLGLVGGFATPILLATGEDHAIGLFGYLLLLNAGLAWVALRKSWPVLSVLSLVFTTLYQWGWVFKFLESSKLPLALGIFLIFPLLAFVAPALQRRFAGETERGAGEDETNLFARTAAASALLPLAFGFYLAAVPAYGARFGLLFGFLFVLRVGLAAVTALRGSRGLHTFAAGSSLLVFVLWFGVSYAKAEAWPGILGFVALFVLFDLVAPWLADRLDRPLGEDDHGAFAGPLLLFSFPVLLYLEPAAAAPGLPFAVLFALLAATAACALLYENGVLYSIGAFFAIAAEAVWSARALTPERLLPGISIYAVFGLFYLGVPMLARRLGRRLPPAGSGALLLLLSLGLLFFLAAGPLAQAALWGLALLLVILNAGLFLESGSLHRPFLAFAGTILSWLLIGVWWATVPLAASLIPALFLVAGFSVLGLVGNLWLRRGEAAGSSEGVENEALVGGPYLALVGHAFLLVIASQARLSIPPWPLLGVLLLLDLAAGVAALWLRRASLWIAALVASDVVLFTWVATAQEAPWPSVALASALAVSALGLLWIGLARRVAGRAGQPERDGAGDLLGNLPGDLSGRIGAGAVAGLFLGQVVAIAAGMAAGAPSLLFLVAAHVAFLLALLYLAVRIDRPWLVPISVAFTTAAIALWQGRWVEGAPWWHELAFAAALYLPYLAFPLILGERARRRRQPYLAAVLASLSFFLIARHALVAGGFSAVIGALPVGQAIALAVLLARLVRMERDRPEGPEGVDAARDPGRLALVAGAVLACLTAAIPLQLEREWITIGWALLAAALAALYLRIPHRGLLIWTAGLLAVVFVRLAVNPAVLEYHPRGSFAVWNWYLYTYLVPALAFFLAAWFLARGDDRLAGPPLPRLSSLAAGGAVVLLFLLINIEIADFFSRGTSLTFGFLTGQATLAEDVAYTLGWALFAIALFLAGIVRPIRVARIAAIVLLLVAVLKGFLHDLANLGGLYRVGSFAGLGLCLALMAVLIQKYVLPRREAE